MNLLFLGIIHGKSSIFLAILDLKVSRFTCNNKNTKSLTFLLLFSFMYRNHLFCFSSTRCHSRTWLLSRWNEKLSTESCLTWFFSIFLLQLPWFLMTTSNSLIWTRCLSSSSGITAPWTPCQGYKSHELTRSGKTLGLVWTFACHMQ